MRKVKRNRISRNKRRRWYGMVVWYGGNNYRDISVLKGRLDEGRQR